MKPSRRILMMLPPLAVLCLLIFKDKFIESPVIEKGISQPAPASHDNLPMGKDEGSATAIRRIAMKQPPAGQVWQFSGNVTGDRADLWNGLAADRRSQGLMPEGRRYEISAFPNIRNMQEGEMIAVGLPDGRTFDGRVNWSRRDKGYDNTHQVSIGFAGDKGGLVMTHDATDGRIMGRLIEVGSKVGWTIDSDDNGALWLVEHLQENMFCRLPAVAAARSNPLPGDPDSTGSSATPPILNSRPSASAALYIDFDGEPRTTYPDWPASNPGGDTFAVPHSGLNVDRMTKVWRRVAEDFIQFNINVTTEKAKYNSAPVARRMRILVGRTLPSHVGGAGFGWMESFRAVSAWGGAYAADVPGWLEVVAYGDPATMSDAVLASLASNISHEFGHTLGLLHDGNDGVQPSVGSKPSEANYGNYYPGHPNNPGDGTVLFDWSPIMGSPYTLRTAARRVIQWAKNDYPGANNNQDDLFIISGTINGFGYAPDENPGYISANQLTPTGTANQVGGEGVVTNRDDSDWWLFNVRNTGATTIEVAPADTALSLPNLDCGFRLEDHLGNKVAGPFRPDDNLEAMATFNLAPGTYYVVAFGTGNKTFSTGGYDSYGSTGRYLVTVNLPPDTVDPVPVILSPAAGPLTNPSISFNGTATDNDRVSGFSLFLRRNSDGAFWNGQYWQVGSAGPYWTGTEWGPNGLARNHNTTTGAWNCTAPLPQVAGSGPGSFNAGSYDFIAIAEDPAGRSKEVLVTVTLDSAGPVVSVGSPTVTLGTAGYAFSGTSQDANGVQEVGCFIRRNSDGLYWNGSGWAAPATTLASNHVPNTDGISHPWACTANLPQPGGQLTQGTYTYIAIATDSLGNNTQADSVVIIDDSQPPQVAVTTPAHKSFVSTLGSIGGTATDMSGIKNGAVTFTLFQVSTGKFWNGSSWVATNTPLTGTVSGNNWSFSAMPQGPFLTAGQYLISASARDNANTLSQQISGVNQTSFRVDLNPPTVSIAAPKDGAVISSLPSVSGVAEDTNGISQVKLYLYRYSDGKFWDGSSWGGGASAILPTQVSGKTWVSLPAANLPQPGSNPTNKLTNGSYNLLAFAVDSAGNQTRADAVFTVELTYTWTGATLRDGTAVNDSRSWDTPENWDPMGVPGSGDKVIIANGDQVDSGTSRTVLGLQLANGMLNFTTADRTLTTTANSAWTGGIMRGIWENQAGAILTISGSADKELRDGSVLNNSGRIVVLGGRPIFAEGNGFVDNPIINNRSGARFRMEGSTDVFHRYSYRSGTPVFNNEPGGVVEAANGLPVWHTFHFNNAGSVEFTGGAALKLNTVTAFLDAAPITGTGSLVQETGSFTLKGDLNASGPQVLFRGGDIAGHGDTTATFKVSAGGRIRLYGGNFANVFTVAAGHRIEIEDAPDGPLPRMFRDGMVMHNRGTVNWRGISPIDCEGNGFVDNPVFNNHTGAVFNARGGTRLFNRFSYRAGVPVFNNEPGALFQKTASIPPVPVLTLDTAIFNNKGAIVCEEGALAFRTTLNHASETPLTGAGTFEFQDGRLGITGLLKVTDTSFAMLGGQMVSEGGTAVLSAAGAARFHLHGGSYDNKFTVNAGDRLEIDDPSGGPVYREFRDGFVLDNFGTVRWYGGSPIVAQGHGEIPNPVINNKSGGLFLAVADGPLFGRASSRSGVPVFNNEAGGTFRKTTAGGELTFDTFNLINSGNLQCNAGVIAFKTSVSHNSTAPLTGPGLFRLSGGNFAIRGPLTADNTQFIIASGDLNMHEDGTALLTSANGAHFRAQGGRFLGSWTLGAGTRMDFETGAAGDAVKFFADGSVFTNRGNVRWLGGGSIQAEGNGFVANPIFVNKTGARFEFAAGGEPFSRASARSGTPLFINEPGAVMENTSAAPVTIHTFDVDQQGLVNSGNGRITYNTGMLLATGSVFAGTAPHRFDSGNLRVNGASTVQAAVFEIRGGTTTGSAAAQFVTIGTGAWKWTEGTLTGRFAVPAGSRFLIADGSAGASVKFLADGTVFDNSGIVEWTGSGPIQADGNGFVDNPVFNNHAGGSFTDMATGVLNRFSYRSGAPVFNNHGTVNVGSGDLTMEGWNFAQHPTGLLKLSVAGTVQGQFGRLGTNFNASLGGTVSATKLNGYEPEDGLLFPFLTAGSVSGAFAAVNGGFTVQYTANSATLKSGIPLNFGDWATAAGLTGEDAEASADTDFDGMSTIAEYVFNTNPKVANAPPETTGRLKIDNKNWFVMYYRRWSNRELAGVTYTAEAGSNLDGWSQVGVIDEPDPDAKAIPGSKPFRCRVEITPDTAKFLRIKASNP